MPSGDVSLSGDNQEGREGTEEDAAEQAYIHPEPEGGEGGAWVLYFLSPAPTTSCFLFAAPLSL